MLEVLQNGRLFHLATKNTSYVIFANEAGRLESVYYGARISSPDCLLLRSGKFGTSSFSPARPEDPRGGGGDILAQEYSGFNAGDMRLSAIAVVDSQGVPSADPHFAGYRRLETKTALHGLPQSFAGRAPESMACLEISMEDPYAGLDIKLLYTVYEDCNVITRSAIIRNTSKGAIRLNRAMSAQIDFPGLANFQFVACRGSWSRERYPERTPLRHGIQINASQRGATGHSLTPAIALVSPDATETAGEAYGFLLEYSGNHYEAVEVDQFDTARVLIGINPELFSWKLEPGEAFETPEAAFTYSAEGLGQMSRNYHDFIRTHIIRSPWNGKHRPILVNNWEATYFNFDTQKIVDIATAASKLGIEMLVLDDGWFGHRDNDKSSLGDWFEYKTKVGDMADLAASIHALGMKFGLWFEPEMISEDSELYKAHPDWVLCVPGRPRSYGRTQLILDMSRNDVIEHLHSLIGGLISRAKIDYIKWDMNRNMTEVYSSLLPADRQGETSHRYILGVYRLHEMLLQDFPNLLIEGCSGGGGRFDAGMLYYLPQIWCSDNTNAMDRLRIQAGTSMFYPLASMGAHINAQHTVERFIPFATRGNVAMAGTFGYELDLTKLTAEEQATAIQLNKDYHSYHDTISEGDYYRLSNAFQENELEAWCCVAKDRHQAVLTVVRRWKPYGYLFNRSRVRVPGLAPDKKYRLAGTDQVFTASALANYGFWCSDLGINDCSSAVYVFNEE